MAFPVELGLFLTLGGRRSCQGEVDVPEGFGLEVLDQIVSLNDKSECRKLAGSCQSPS